MYINKFAYLYRRFNRHGFIVKYNEIEKPITFELDLGIKTLDDYKRFADFVEMMHYKRSSLFEWNDGKSYIHYNAKNSTFDMIDRDSFIGCEIDMDGEHAYEYILQQMEKLRRSIETWFDSMVV
jgi:hypothetical protein